MGLQKSHLIVAGLVLIICAGNVALAQRVYWNYSGRPISVANIDGTNQGVFLNESVHGLAVDAVHDRVYWNNPVDDTLRWAKRDGTDVQTLVTSSGVGDIALDVISGRVYWNSNGGAIHVANLDGSQHAVFLSEPVHGIAVDPVQRQIYWNNPVTGALKVANLDGTNPHALISSAGSGAIALDLLHRRLYWNSNGGALMAANLDGSNEAVFLAESVHGIAVDAVGDRIYWMNPSAGTLRSAKLDGTDVVTLASPVGTGDVALDSFYVPEPACALIGILWAVVCNRRPRRTTGVVRN